MHQNCCELGLRTIPHWGSKHYSAFPDPIAGFKRAYFKAPTSNGIGVERNGGKRGAQVIYAPGARNSRAATNFSFII